MNKEINLLKPKEEKQSSLLQNIALLRIVSIGFIFLVSFASITLFIVMTLSPLPKLQEREKDEARTLSLFQTKMLKIALTRERLNTINQVMQKRVVYTNILDFLEKQLQQDMAIDSLKIDSNKITLSLSSISLQSLEVFLNNVKQGNSTNTLFQKITLKEMYLDAEKAKYILSMELVKL